MYVTHFVFNMLLHYHILDGTSTGDGSADLTNGMCEKQDTNRKCLSTGECRACKFISTSYEGCDITSMTPICDANSGTSTVDFTTYADSSLTAECVACKKAGIV